MLVQQENAWHIAISWFSLVHSVLVLTWDILMNMRIGCSQIVWTLLSIRYHLILPLWKALEYFTFILYLICFRLTSTTRSGSVSVHRWLTTLTWFAVGWSGRRMLGWWKTGKELYLSPGSCILAKSGEDEQEGWNATVYWVQSTLAEQCHTFLPFVHCTRVGTYMGGVHFWLATHHTLFATYNWETYIRTV